MPAPITPIRLLAVDDHALRREGIAALVQQQEDMVLVGEAADGEEALEQFRRLRPDVTLLDLQMPKRDGIETLVALRKEFPAARIVVLSTYRGDAQATRALKAGAMGYLLKSGLRQELLETVRAVHAGQRRIPPEIASSIAEHLGDESLSPRETDVLRLVATGAANKQIARELGITDETVKAHMKNILGKLSAHDRTHAVTIALRRGILEL